MKLLGLFLLFFSHNGFCTFISYQQLLHSGSKSMIVNGSSVSVAFSYSPSVPVRIKSVSLLMEKTGVTPFNKFATLTALTNGLLIQYTIGGVSKTLALIKDNSDLCNIFSDSQHFGSSAILSILSIVTPEGFGNSNNVFKGRIPLNNADVIITNSDSFTATVQDDLSTVGTLEMGLMVESDS